MFDQLQEEVMAYDLNTISQRLYDESKVMRDSKSAEHTKRRQNLHY